MLWDERRQITDAEARELKERFLAARGPLRFEPPELARGQVHMHTEEVRYVGPMRARWMTVGRPRVLLMVKVVVWGFVAYLAMLGFGELIGDVDAGPYAAPIACGVLGFGAFVALVVRVARGG